MADLQRVLRAELSNPADEELREYRLQLEPGQVPCAEANLRVYPPTDGGSAAWWTSAGTVQALETRVDTRTEFVVFEGEAEGRMPTQGALIEAELVGGATTIDGEEVSPSFSLQGNTLIASAAFYGVVKVEISAPYRVIRWAAPADEEIGETPVVLVAYLAPAKRPVTIQLDIDGERCRSGNLVAAFLVVSRYLVNADGPSEMPAGWDANTTRTDGVELVPDECYEMLRTHAVGSLSGDAVHVQYYSPPMFAPKPALPPNGFELHRSEYPQDAEMQERIDALDWEAILAALDEKYPGIVEGSL